MDPVLIGAIGFGIMLLLMLLHVPIGAAMMLVGGVGFAVLTGRPAVALSMIGNEAVSAIGSMTLIIIPLYLIMGALAGSSGLAAEVYKAAQTWVGHFRGGLAMATVVGSAGFASVSGSSLATAATFSKVALPEMERRGYQPGFGAGAIAAGGTLGILIPPSTIMVIYAFLTEQNILSLYLAGIIPGLLTMCLYCLAVYVEASRNPTLAPTSEPVDWRTRLRATAGAWGILVVVAIMTIGIYSGIFTVSEAAAIGVVACLAFAVARGRLGRRGYLELVRETAASMGMIYFIIIGAGVFGNFLSLSHLPQLFVESLSSLSLSPYAFIAAIIVFFVVVGCFFDSISAMIITLPFVYPLILNLGFDPIWFGVLMVILIEVGLITPPFGINIFIVNSVRPDIPLGSIFRGIVPFLGADVVRIALIVAFPQIVLFLLR